MNDDLMLRVAERFSIEELAEAAQVTPRMFTQAFEEELFDNLHRLADIDLGFVLEEEDDEL